MGTSKRMNERLAHHTISAVKFRTVYTRYPRLHGKNALRDEHGWGGAVPIVELTTDRGARGWGVTDPLDRAYSDHPSIKGQPLSSLFAAERGILHPELLPFDLALHDLAGRILGLPVCRMLAENANLRVPVYDGAIYMNDLLAANAQRGLQAVLKDCAQDYALGYRSFKLKIGRGRRWMEPQEGFTRDVELVHAVHAQFPNAKIMVDANDAFDPESAIRFLEAVASVPLEWIEEPFPEHRQGLQRLKSWLADHAPDIQIADGENRPVIADLLNMAEEGILDLLQPDVVTFGFTAWRALIKDLLRVGCKGSPHAWGDVLKTYYCAHLAAAYPQVIPMVEGVLGVTEDVDASEYVLIDGALSLPSAPGFGLTLNG